MPLLMSSGCLSHSMMVQANMSWIVAEAGMSHVIQWSCSLFCWICRTLMSMPLLDLIIPLGRLSHSVVVRSSHSESRIIMLQAWVICPTVEWSSFTDSPVLVVWRFQSKLVLQCR